MDVPWPSRLTVDFVESLKIFNGVDNLVTSVLTSTGLNKETAVGRRCDHHKDDKRRQADESQSLILYCHFFKFLQFLLAKLLVVACAAGAF